MWLENQIVGDPGRTITVFAENPRFVGAGLVAIVSYSRLDAVLGPRLTTSHVSSCCVVAGLPFALESKEDHHVSSFFLSR